MGATKIAVADPAPKVARATQRSSGERLAKNTRSLEPFDHATGCLVARGSRR
jgi:hypothetical protein